MSRILIFFLIQAEDEKKAPEFCIPSTHAALLIHCFLISMWAVEHRGAVKVGSFNK